MNIRDKELIERIRDYLGLRNKVYTYYYPGKDGAKRGPQAMLIVREIGSLKNIIVPTFYSKLVGYKGKQLNDWLEKIGTDPLVPKNYRVIYRLYKLGFYDKGASK
jgi:hypothetical protein